MIRRALKISCFLLTFVVLGQSDILFLENDLFLFVVSNVYIFQCYINGAYDINGFYV